MCLDVTSIDFWGWKWPAKTEYYSLHSTLPSDKGTTWKSFSKQKPTSSQQLAKHCLFFHPQASHIQEECFKIQSYLQGVYTLFCLSPYICSNFSAMTNTASELGKTTYFPPQAFVSWKWKVQNPGIWTPWKGKRRQKKKKKATERIHWNVRKIILCTVIPKHMKKFKHVP